MNSDGIQSLLLSWKFCVFLVVLYVLHYYNKILKLRKILPPGPMPVPLLGNVWLIRNSKPIRDKLLELSYIYGDPYTFWFGGMLGIIVSRRRTIREVFVNQQDILSDRQDSVLFDFITQGSQSIPLGKYSPQWKGRKKIAVQSTRKIVENDALEVNALSSIRELIEFALMTENHVFDLREHITLIVFNIICAFGYGKRYTMQDSEFKRLAHLNVRERELFMTAAIIDIVPGSKHLPISFIPVIRKLDNVVQEMLTIMRQQVNRHRESYKEYEKPRDFTDAVLREQADLQNSGVKVDCHLNDAHLSWMLLDFFTAGTDTTISVLSWFFLFMVLHPEIQEQCSEEIKREIGERDPSVSDKPKLPFLDACIQETMRLRPPVPLAIPHAALQETKIGAHTIPKGAVLYPLIYGMHTDFEGEFQPNAELFDPINHFLNRGRLPGFMPFGGGRRSCLGEQLARNSLFLVSAGLLQRLRFEKVPHLTYSDMPDPEVDSVTYTLPYLVKVVPR